MAFKLGRFLKKAVKLGAKIARPILATTPVGALALRAQQTLKSLGGNLKAERLGKLEPLSVRASVEKIAPSASPSLRKFPASAAAGTKRRISVRSLKRKASRMPQDRRTANGKGKRSPPPGGLDLARMAAQWRAAGKPGTWLGWIKANPIKRAG